MGLLILAGIAALVLTLLTVVTVALVQFVLLLTLPNTLLVLVVVGGYWFVDSRRRQVAKGFYSCKQVPGSATTVTATAKPTKAASATETTKPPRHRDLRKKHKVQTKNTIATLMDRLMAQENTNQQQQQDHSGSAVPETEQETTRHSVANDDAGSSSDEVPVMAVAATAMLALPSSPSSSASSTSSSSRAATGMQLPDLRRRKWKVPSRSMPLEQQLKAAERKSTGSSSACNSPRRPELYDSPRSVAMEQKRMKSALESDGYWIGDFRVPAPVLPKRSQSTGVASTSKAIPTSSRPTTSTSSTVSSSSSSCSSSSSSNKPRPQLPQQQQQVQQRTAPRAV